MKPPHFPAKAKRVIYLFQVGAPSQLDLYDPKPMLAKYDGQPIPADFVNLGKLSGGTQYYVPWMQATYFLAINKKAMQYLPSGADVNALTYDQLIAWGKNILDKTGKRMIGLPAGNNSLLHRLLQGYFYPSYTGGLVTTYKSADAETMWKAIKDLWQYTNPQSTTYAFMQDPLQSEEVWIGFDHAARLINVLKAKPNDFMAVPAPAGPKGRYFMTVLVGLGIPKTTPNQKGSDGEGREAGAAAGGARSEGRRLQQGDGRHVPAHRHQERGHQDGAGRAVRAASEGRDRRGREMLGSGRHLERSLSGEVALWPSGG